jgi:type II secretory pathway pseudopilin PulG
MRSEERGTTLTEILATAAILTVALAALVPVLSIARASWDRVERHTELLQNGRRALDKLVRDVRSARSFAMISPTLLRFATALGDGTGASPTVEYRLNAGTGEMEYRVAADFAYRRRITITATAAVPAGYAVAVVFDHAAMVAAGKSLASGDDVRLRYWTGTRWVELDRFKDVPTSWNTTGTRVWFRLQAAIAAGRTDNNYFLHYGELGAAPPPANGDYIFLDYEDGATLAGWTRRDACSGVHAPSPDGFVFTANSGANCFRQLSKDVAHGDVEVFWAFQSHPPAGLNTTRHQPGMSARRGATGTGYLVVPGDDTNRRLRIRRVTSWTTTGTVISQTGTTFRLTPGTLYYGRFALVGNVLRAKYWAAGSPEPAGWTLQVINGTYGAGAAYGQVDGLGASAAAPQDHRHRHLIVRPRVEPEPAATLAPEERGNRADPFEPLAGPFRAMAVQCFNSAGAAIDCAAIAAVRSVQISLTVTDPSGEVADVVLTSRAYRQIP